ncbi:OTUD7A [Bugula neritina]|uniref:OTUD7A n=1 Tax=Bugula neritina TaxID=10212 RepID=A0A7J7ITT5_BUGNE|nr:OTUD7A [Bugula neritina]
MSSRNPPSAKFRSGSHRNGAPVRTHNKPVAPVPDGLVAAAPAAEERGVDINQLVHSFIEQTGVMDETLARDFLVAKSWNLPEAVTSYRQTFLSEGDQINHPASPLATSPVTSDNPWRKPPSLVSQNAGLKSQSTASNNNIDRDRHQFVRGLSKVYELRDGAESIKIDKDNLLNESSLPENGSSKHHLSTSISLDNSFMIPDLSELSEGLAEYIEHELIDFVTMNILEQTGHINWWAQHSLSRRLWPLHTNGDGNCLLHAASLVN